MEKDPNITGNVDNSVKSGASLVALFGPGSNNKHINGKLNNVGYIPHLTIQGVPSFKINSGDVKDIFKKGVKNTITGFENAGTGAINNAIGSVFGPSGIPSPKQFLDNVVGNVQGMITGKAENYANAFSKKLSDSINGFFAKKKSAGDIVEVNSSIDGSTNGVKTGSFAQLSDKMFAASDSMSFKDYKNMVPKDSKEIISKDITQKSDKIIEARDVKSYAEHMASVNILAKEDTIASMGDFYTAMAFGGDGDSGNFTPYHPFLYSINIEFPAWSALKNFSSNNYNRKTLQMLANGCTLPNLKTELNNFATFTGGYNSPKNLVIPTDQLVIKFISTEFSTHEVLFSRWISETVATTWQYDDNKSDFGGYPFTKAIVTIDLFDQKVSKIITSYVFNEVYPSMIETINPDPDSKIVSIRPVTFSFDWFYIKAPKAKN